MHKLSGTFYCKDEGVTNVLPLTAVFYLNDISLIEDVGDKMEQRLRRLPNQLVPLAIDLGHAFTSDWNIIPQASGINEVPFSSMRECKC